MEKRKCKICCIEKPMSEFPGKRWQCKKCKSNLANKWYQRKKKENPEHIKEIQKRADKKRNKTPERLAYQRQLYWKYRDKILKKRKANYKSNWKPRKAYKDKCHAIFEYAIKIGKIKKQPCSICGEKAEGHHFDYSKPLEVIWFCRKHHAEKRQH